MHPPELFSAMYPILHLHLIWWDHGAIETYQTPRVRGLEWLPLPTVILNLTGDHSRKSGLPGPQLRSYTRLHVLLFSFSCQMYPATDLSRAYSLLPRTQNTRIDHSKCIPPAFARIMGGLLSPFGFLQLLTKPQSRVENELLMQMHQGREVEALLKRSGYAAETLLITGKQRPENSRRWNGSPRLCPIYLGSDTQSSLADRPSRGKLFRES